jgi:hypothetical protein
MGWPENQSNDGIVSTQTMRYQQSAGSVHTRPPWAAQRMVGSAVAMLRAVASSLAAIMPSPRQH